MFRIRLLTFCTVPHAAQFAPTICANLRWQPLQLLMVGGAPDAISLIVSGGMSTISKRLEAVSFWRKTSSSRRMRSTSTRAVASSEVLMNSKPRKATRGTSLPSGPAFAPPPTMMARKIPNAAFMAEEQSRARPSVISTSVILHMRIGAAFLLDGVLAGDLTDQNVGQNRQTTLFFVPNRIFCSPQRISRISEGNPPWQSYETNRCDQDQSSHYAQASCGSLGRGASINETGR